MNLQHLSPDRVKERAAVFTQLALLGERHPVSFKVRKRAKARKVDGLIGPLTRDHVVILDPAAPLAALEKVPLHHIRLSTLADGKVQALYGERNGVVVIDDVSKSPF